MPAIRVLIADDDRCVRKCLNTLLGMEDGVTVVGEAVDGVEATALAQVLRPDVVLLDVEMPRMDGIEATRSIKRLAPGARVLILSVYDRAREDAEQAGADCFLLKDCGRPVLAAAIRRVCEPERQQRSIPAEKRGAGSHGRDPHPVHS